MLLVLSKKYKVLQYAAIVLLTAALWIRPFISDCSWAASGPESPLHQALLSLTWIDTYTIVIAGFLLIIVEAFYLNYLLVRHKLVASDSLISLVLFTMLMSQSVNGLFLNPVSCASLFVLLSLDCMLRSIGSSKALFLSFLAAVMLSISSLFFFPFIFFLPILFIGISLTWVTKVRLGYLSSFAGMVLTFLILFTYFLLVDDFALKMEFYVSWFANPPFFWDKLELYQYLLIGWQLLLLASAVKYTLSRLKKLEQRSRQYILFAIYFLLFALFPVIYSMADPGMAILSTALPYAIFISMYLVLTTEKRLVWMIEMSLIGWYITIFVYNIYLIPC